MAYKDPQKGRESCRRYHQEHKEEIHKKHKKYRQKHLKKIKKQLKEWRKKHKEYNKEYHNKHKKERNEYNKRWAKNHKKERKKYREENKERTKKLREKRLNGWRSLFSNPSYCEICDEQITFNSGNFRTSIYFDHKHEGKEKIKERPTGWLANHERTPENEAIWKSCNFGILCLNCNGNLPTKNRIKFLKRALEYAQEG